MTYLHNEKITVESQCTLQEVNIVQLRPPSPHTKTFRLYFLLEARHCTCEVEGKGDEAVVFAEDAKRLLPLHQCEEVISHGLTIEEVVHTQQEVPAGQRGATNVHISQLSDSAVHSVCLQKNQ